MNQLTPSEKAKELIDKFANAKSEDGFINTNKFRHKQCALVACNEIIDAIDWHEFETPTKQLNYWLDVRKELEKNY
jgi:hypothetical protein